MKVLKALTLLILLSSCSMRINLTPSQKRDQEAKKFTRFRVRQDESRFFQIIGFVGVGAGIYYNQNIRPQK